MPKFRKGDKVRLRYGHTRMTVMCTDSRDNTLRACYDPNNGNPPDIEFAQSWRSQRDYVYWDGLKTSYRICKKYPHRNCNNQVLDENIIFKTKTGKLGTFITTENNGNIILRMSNKQGTLKSFKPCDLEEIVPYTIAVQTPNGLYKCDYIIKPGTVEVGDVLKSDTGNIYVVRTLDTKSRSPKSTFKGSRLVTEPLV